MEGAKGRKKGRERNEEGRKKIQTQRNSHFLRTPFEAMLYVLGIVTHKGKRALFHFFFSLLLFIFLYLKQPCPSLL